MSNQRDGNASVDAWDEWRRFDRLPRELKELVWNAPYQFTCEGWAAMVRSQGLRETRRMVIVGIARRAVRKISKGWCREHPCQARFAEIAHRFQRIA